MTELEHEEFPRLLDGVNSPFERAILDAGRYVPSSDRRRLQVLLALGVGTSVALGSKASLALAAGWKKVIIGSAVVASGTVGVVAYQQVSQPAEEPAVVEQAAPASEQAVTLAVPVVEPQVEDSDPSEDEVLPNAEQPIRAKAAPIRKRVARSVSKPPVPEQAAGSSLQDEVAALDSARGALRSGQPRRALGHLADYSGRFPKGSLRLEAEALRIQALAASGNQAEASRRAKRILERSPNSVLASRLRRYVTD